MSTGRIVITPGSFRQMSPPGDTGLAADAEPRDEASVTLDVIRPHIVEEATTMSDELHQTSPSVVIALVQAKMLREVVDPFREDSHLDLWGSGVRLMEAVLGDSRRLVRHT